MWFSVGEFGFWRSRLHAPSSPSDAVAAATAHRLTMRISGLRISVSESRAERKRARNWITAEVEPAVRRGGLHRPDTARVRPEQVDLRVVPAVIAVSYTHLRAHE